MSGSYTLWLCTIYKEGWYNHANEWATLMSKCYPPLPRKGDKKEAYKVGAEERTNSSCETASQELLRDGFARSRLKCETRWRSLSPGSPGFSVTVPVEATLQSHHPQAHTVVLSPHGTLQLTL